MRGFREIRHREVERKIDDRIEMPVIETEEERKERERKRKESEEFCARMMAELFADDYETPESERP